MHKLHLHFMCIDCVVPVEVKCISKITASHSSSDTLMPFGYSFVSGLYFTSNPLSVVVDAIRFTIISDFPEDDCSCSW